MLKGCRTLPAAARSTRVSRSNNARFMSNAVRAAARPAAAAAVRAGSAFAAPGAGRLAAFKAGSVAACTSIPSSSSTM